MASVKTLLAPEEQWKRTVSYVGSLRGRAHSLAGPRVLLVVMKVPHRLFSVGDVFVMTWGNGMNERWGMSGVSSKGARLKDYFIPLRSVQYDDFELPGDLTTLKWDDPAVGRFVADLRASSRRRVGASIPAPPQEPPPTPHVEGLRFDGCYRSRRGPRHKRGEYFNRNYLRFFPDGTAIASPYGGFSRWHQQNFLRGPWDTSGRYTLEGNSISICIVLKGEVIEQYSGTMDGGRLRLARRCFKGWSRSRVDDVYKFGPWKDD